MDASGAVELALGLLFIFLVFSLIVSAINEAITKVLAWRSRHLWRALRRLLDPGEPALARDQRPKVNAPDTGSWTGRLYAHPLIRDLERRSPTPRSRISWLPRRDFSRAIIDLLVPDGQGNTKVDQVRAKVLDLPEDTPLRAPLLAILSEAGDRIDELTERIGEWFESRMAILSSVYRRNVRVLLVAVGLVVAVVCNVDAIGAARHLYRDDALRAAVAEQAVAVVAECEGEDDPVGCTRRRVGRVDAAIRLPVGWPDPDGVDGLQVLGWMISAVALGQGAPFWFDLLRRASRLRR